MSEKRGSFSGKLGFVMAAAGSAVGLGNIWRFPYLAAEHGGGIFLLVYLILVLTFGYALMKAEIALGRKTGLSVIGAFKKLDQRWSFLGLLAALVPVLILPYYSVIGGWVCKYFFTFVSGGMPQTAEMAMVMTDDGLKETPVFFSNFTADPIEPLGWFLLFIGLTALVVLFGVDKGVERFSKVLMPILIILSIWIPVLYVIAFIPLGWSLFRSFSKNVYKRQQERYAYLRFIEKTKTAIRVRKRMLAEFKTHRYFKCPQCKTYLRVPKGKGKIKITCPNCKTDIIKKT